MSSEFGVKLRTTVFGESHGKAVGVVAEGFPAGEPVDMAQLVGFMDRRRPGKNNLSTQRREADIPEFLSGVTDGRTNGFPLCIVIQNTDQHSSDYTELSHMPRPSHADYAAYVKWQGCADMRGGGHFSGRLTAPLCAAGGIALQILARRGVYIGAHLASVAGVEDEPFPLWPDAVLFTALAGRELPVLDEQRGEKMREAIQSAAAEADSVGGIIECAAVGLPAGIGEPMFGGLENRLSAALFGIPAVKGIEFGTGFAVSAMRGSESNDPFILKDGRVMTQTNNSGGINGGISNGMPVVFRLAIKPTPSIGKRQSTVNLSRMEETTLEIHGRHDPCIALRAVPVVEAVAALTLLDCML